MGLNNLRGIPRRPAGARTILPSVEKLEARLVPYAVSGAAWPSPQLITISFEPDGTNIGGARSNLFSGLNATMPTSVFEHQILNAFQAWAVQSNINIGVVSDGGQASGVAGADVYQWQCGCRGAQLQGTASRY